MNNTDYPNWLYNEYHVFYDIYFCIIGIFLFLPLIILYVKVYKKYAQEIKTTANYCVAILISLVTFILYLGFLSIIGGKWTFYGSNLNIFQKIADCILPITYVVGVSLIPIALFSGILAIVVLIINQFRQKKNTTPSV